MQNTSTVPKNRKSGFTLVELLVILVTIGLLITFVLPVMIRGGRRAARVTRCLGNLKNISAGTDRYSSSYGGVIATGVPPEPVRPGVDSLSQPEFFASWNRVFGWKGEATFHYGVMNRYWFTGLAQYIAQEESAKAVWDEVFFCPEDTFYSDPGYVDFAPGTVWQRRVIRISYLMSDTAFWAPEMFTGEKIGQILEEDELYNDGEERPATSGPAQPNTQGRRYLQTSQVKFPAKKVYIFEVNAFHDNPRLGYNTRGLKATALFFDGHVEKVQASSAENLPNDLFIKVKCRMGWTDEAPDKEDPLWWYYSTTRNGIHGRDFIK